MTNTDFPTTDDDARAIMTESMLKLARQMPRDARLIADDDIGDDDTDTMPARAMILFHLIAALATTDIDPLDALNELLADDDFRDNLATIDFKIPLIALLDDHFGDDPYDPRDDA